MPALTSAGFRTIAPDLRGFGDSNRPDTLDAYKLTNVVADVARVLDHPRTYRDAGFRQREKAWYTLLFQFKGIAEQWLSDDNWANFRQWSHPDADEVIDALSRPGALTASLLWYRANVPPAVLVAPPLELPAVAAPTIGGVLSSGNSL